MKKALLILPAIAFTFGGCSNSNANSTSNNGTTKVSLNLSNFNRYISSTRYEGFTGAAGYSPYEAWLEFKGSLSLGVYEVTVTYKVDNNLYSFRLDVSGGGKTNSFDRSLGCLVTNISGFVKYSV